MKDLADVLFVLAVLAIAFVIVMIIFFFGWLVKLFKTKVIDTFCYYFVPLRTNIEGTVVAKTSKEEVIVVSDGLSLSSGLGVVPTIKVTHYFIKVRNKLGKTFKIAIKPLCNIVVGESVSLYCKKMEWEKLYEQI